MGINNNMKMFIPVGVVVLIIVGYWVLAPNYQKGLHANWHLYRNQEYGFTFKYPPGWNIAQKGELLILKTDTGTHMTYENAGYCDFDSCAQAVADQIVFIPDGTIQVWISEYGDLQREACGEHEETLTLHSRIWISCLSLPEGLFQPTLSTKLQGTEKYLQFIGGIAHGPHDETTQYDFTHNSIPYYNFLVYQIVQTVTFF